MKKTCLGIETVFVSLAISALLNGANASGYGLREFSTIAMGSAYAGSAATGSDASFLAYNPAALGGVADYDSSVSIVGIFPNSSATYSAVTSAATPTSGLATPSDFIKDAAVPSLAARMRLSQAWAAGLVVYAPWGLMTNYPAGWAGRYYARDSKLLTVDISPSLSYQPVPNLTLAAGAQIQYARGSLSSVVDVGTLGATLHIPGSVPGAQDANAKVSADDWSVGFSLGMLWEISPGTSVGVGYQSAISHELRGPLKFTPDSSGLTAAIKGATGLFTDTDSETGLTTPDRLGAGARVRVAPGWTALFEVDWTNWSRFHELRINAVNPFQPDDVTVTNWKDSWMFALGAEFQPDEKWTWRAGVALDQTPIPDATLEPRVPDADRTWISAGVTYHASANMDFSAAVGHLFLPERDVSLSATNPANALRGNLTGKTNSSVNVIGLQFSYRR